MKIKKIWPIILIVIIIATAAGVILFNSTDSAKFKKQLNLGQRYLSEMKYEEAVVAFNQAIEIDPRSVDAYLGLADAYIGLGDEEAALAALKKGYEATGDERLKERIDEMEASTAEEEAEISEAAMDSDEIARRVNEISEILGRDGGPGFLYSHGTTNFLTYDQIEAAYRPLAEELEMYLENAQGDWEKKAWGQLSSIYCHLGEMEKCLEVRRRGYESTGAEWLMPDVYEDENGYKYDEYGRMVSASDGTNVTYTEANRYITYDWIFDGDSIHNQLEYDSLGRIQSVLTYESGSEEQSEYQYQGDYSVTVISRLSGEQPQSMTITYDEYGCYSESDMTEWQWME